MPYVKSKDIRTTPLRSLKYICNPEKTDGGLLVSSVNCMSNPKNAYEEMKRVYEFFSGRSFNESIPENGKGKVKLIHYVQSFDPKDNISPERANSIALATVRDMFGENVQAVAATHTDTQHCHNHIIINVYDLAGKRFYSNQTTLKKLKQISDSVYLRHGIKPYDKSQCKGVDVAYCEWAHKKRGTSWKEKIRQEIDGLISIVKNLDELLYELEQKGYTVKRGKYISVKAEGQQRFVRLKTLGDSFAEENLVQRINRSAEFADRKKRDKFHRSYKNLCDTFADKCGAYRNTKPAVQTHSFYYGQYLTVVNENLNSIESVRLKLSETVKLKDEAEKAVAAANEKYSEMQRTVNLALHYFNDLKGMQKIFPKSERDKSAVTVIKQYGLKSVEDIQPLKESAQKFAIELASLRENLNTASEEVRKYQDIVDTFDMMNSGEDYISRLVREARERCTLDEWDKILHENCKSIRYEIGQGQIFAGNGIQHELADMLLQLKGRVPDHGGKFSSLVRSLAVMKADNIATEKELSAAIGRMKASEKVVENEISKLRQLQSALKEDIHRAEIWLNNKDRQFPNQEWLEECRRSAEKHGVYDVSGIERLKKVLAEYGEKEKAVDERRLFYYNKVRDYSGVRDSVRDVRKERFIDNILNEEEICEKHLNTGKYCIKKKK